MKILVSGATGFVGGAIARHLLDAGYEVKAMSRSTGRAMKLFAASEAGRQGLADGRLSFVQADVTKPETLAEAVTGVGAIVQAAQFTGAPVENAARGLTYMNVDRNGTMNLIEAIAKVYGPRQGPRLLYMSGISVSPGSRFTWDKAKWEAEEAIRASGLDATIVRCCWAFGKGDAALNRILHYSDHLPFVPIFGDGQEPLTPVFVEDIGRLFALAIGTPEKTTGLTAGLGGPDRVTLDEFLHLALQAMGRTRMILHIPKTLGRVQGGLMQFLPGRPLTPDAVDFVAQAGAATDADRRILAEKFPEFRATPLKEALGSYLSPHR